MIPLTGSEQRSAGITELPRAHNGVSLRWPTFAETLEPTGGGDVGIGQQTRGPVPSAPAADRASTQTGLSLPRFSSAWVPFGAQAEGVNGWCGRYHFHPAPGRGG